MGKWTQGWAGSTISREFPAALFIPLAIAVLLLASCGGGSSEATEPDTPTPSPTATRTNTPTPTPSPTPTPTPTPVPMGVLDGVMMDQDDYERRIQQVPIAVMIDNHPAAYPHSGLDKADLVFEAFVEGQVTRYMAVFWRQDSDYIEPVRSLRTPFVMWAHELQVLVGHVGSAEYAGEANAEAWLVEWGVPRLDHDEPIGPPTFYRNPNRRAPHNTVTSTDALRTEAERRGIIGERGIEGLESWLFKEPGDGTGDYPAAHVIDISFSGRQIAGTVVRWVWDADRGAYGRLRSGAAHADGRTGAQLMFTNVVVMTVNPRVVSPYGHVVLDQIGEGPATVYLDGRRIDGTWQKPSPAARTRFYDASGAEVAFNRGSTWIEVVAPSSAVSDFAR